MTELKRYYIRFAEVQDHPKIMHFYENHPHQNILKRDPKVIQDLTDKGAVILIEDEEGNIAASSITYSHTIDVSQGAYSIARVKWQEIGTTQIVSANGYDGLFDTMVTMQTLHAWLVEAPEDCFVAQMCTAPLQKMAAKLGWQACTPKQGLLDSKAYMIDPTGVHPPKHAENWFCCGEEGLTIMARSMLHVLNDPVVPHRHNPDDKIIIDFSKNRLIDLFQDEIRALAARDVSPEKTPQRMALVKLREKIMIEKLGQKKIAPAA